jgi:hypothetical protein
MIEVRGERCEDPDGELDEVVASDAHVHLEQMSADEWILIIQDAKEQVIVNISGPDGVSAFVFERTPNSSKNHG